VGLTLRIDSNIIRCITYLCLIYRPTVSAVSVRSDPTNGDDESTSIKRVHLIARFLFLNHVLSWDQLHS
jgi:hypothetical protein